MVVALAALVLGKSYGRALAWADRIYRGAIPMPVVADPGDVLENALDAYQQVEDTYGSGPEIQRRIGACLISMGSYSEAAKASPVGSTEKRIAETRLSIGRAVQQQIYKDVIQIEPDPGSRGRYLALIGDRTEGDRWVEHRRLILFSVDPTGRVTELNRQEVPDSGEYRHGRIYVARLARTGPSVAILYQEFAADRDLTDESVFQIGGKHLNQIASFDGNEGVEIFPCTNRHGLAFQIGATWKVYWSDVYEWKRGEFRFANATYPELFGVRLPLRQYLGVSSEIDKFYPDWMEEAAQLDIHRRFAEAKTAWRTAERYCKLAIRAGDQHSIYTSQFYGLSEVNLKEIRQRLRWLRQRDYNHWLLYRPCDDDLEVPPFDLGKAFE